MIYSDDRGNVVNFYEQYSDGTIDEIGLLDREHTPDGSSYYFDGSDSLMRWAIKNGYEEDIKTAIQTGNVGDDYYTTILGNLLSYLVKLDDCPASAQEHLDHALFILSLNADRMKMDLDEEKKEILINAKEHMLLYAPT